MGQFVIGQGRQRIQRLDHGAVEVAPGGFLLGNPTSRPRENDIAGRLTEFAGAVFEEDTGALAIDTENGKEIGPERPALTMFLGPAPPFVAIFFGALRSRSRFQPCRNRAGVVCGWLPLALLMEVIARNNVDSPHVHLPQRA